VAHSALSEDRFEQHPGQFYYGVINGSLFLGFIFYEPKQVATTTTA